jgi:hypothetical protein
MKYWLIIILFVPFSLYGILRALTLYKLNKINSKKMLIKLLFWLSLMAISILAKYIVSEAIVLSITAGDYITIYDIVIAFGLLISLMLNIKLAITLNNNSNRLNKLLSIYSIKNQPKRD